MILRHLDEIPVESGEQLPVLRLVGRAGFPAAGGAFEAGFELSRVQPIQEFHKRRTSGFRGRHLVSLAFGDGFSEPTYGVQLASLVLCEQVYDQVLDSRARQRWARIVRFCRELNSVS